MYLNRVPYISSKALRMLSQQVKFYVCSEVLLLLFKKKCSDSDILSGNTEKEPEDAQELNK